METSETGEQTPKDDATKKRAEMPVNTVNEPARGPERASDQIMTSDVQSQGRADISDDIEKDINIDVNISNNSSSFITHHSNITITYYNTEKGDEGGSITTPEGKLVRYSIFLPEDLVAKLDDLVQGAKSDRNKVGLEAYEALLRKRGSAARIRTENRTKK